MSKWLIKKILPEGIVESFRTRNVLKRLKKIKKRSDFESLRPEVKGIRENLKNSSVLLDIGANCGEISFFLSKEFPSAKIYSFEPGDRAFKILKKTKKKFNLKNLFIYKFALGNKKEIVGMSMPEENDTLAFISKEEDSKNKFYVEKLDDFIKKKNIGKIDFIKIDVEGFEMKVLEGGLKTIKKDRPLILMEADENHQKRFGGSKKKLIQFMKGLGYKESWQNSTDYLFIPKKK